MIMWENRDSYLKTLYRIVTGLPVIICLCTSCSVAKSSFNPSKKYSPAELQKDYAVFRGALEETHPGIYWYTPKEVMDEHFEWGEARLKDSMNEDEFKKTLSYVIAKINCGHTVVRNSKDYSRFQDSTTRFKIFPLSMKIWSGNEPLVDDTVTVAANLNRKDSILKRGVVVKKINNQPVSLLVDTFFKYISSDGYNYTHKQQSLSNRGSFGTAYTTLFGLKENYLIDFIDSSGNENSIKILPYNPRTDSANKAAIARFGRIPKEDRRRQLLQSARSLRIDSANKAAFLDLGSFTRGLKLKRFFRQSFKKIQLSGTKSLVVDVRGNGGGSVTNSTTLSKFIANKKFKLADSLYAPRRNSDYKRYIDNYFFNRLFMVLMTKKKSDGKFHFGYFERHYFKPKKKGHFDGTVYILIGGNSFSATTLFTQAVKDQQNVIVVGEETGGGAYGNSAWLIPDATLPITGIRFRLPLFRLVINKNIPKDGKGIQPEIEVKPTVDAIRRGADFKMEKVIELINAANLKSNYTRE
jgi:hypothetical protein